MRHQLLLMLEPQQVLVWTCVLVFIATSAITLLGIIKKIDIDLDFLNKLFIALILEVVTIGVLAFKNSFKPTPISEFIKIVSPLNNFNASNNPTISVYGAYNKSSDETIRAELKVNNQTIPLTNTSSEENIFYTNIDSSTFKKSIQPTVCFSIYKDSTKIVSDCITLKTK